ncbi:Mitochondrial chaperone Frataxin [Mortierella sp. GBA30]|nr:Mitochondrial chaperone Frataxin [Mortierella sp. GBA30]
MSSPATASFTRAFLTKFWARPTAQQPVRRFSHSNRFATHSSRVATSVSGYRLPRIPIPSISSSHVSASCSSRTYASMASSSSSSSSSEPQYVVSELTDDEYHTISDACMDRMVEYFEDLGDEHEIPGYDVEFQSGVMTLKLGAKGTYVVNKQPPNKQLWLSSPTSGPKRYDYDTKHQTWFYGRDHHSLKYLLDTEISKAIGIEIDVPLDGLKF